MTITKERITNSIISWLDKDPYSKKHWAAVAKVVKPDNLLDELLSNCFELVDWRKTNFCSFSKPYKL